MKKIAVLTTTRADYGLLKPVIVGLRGSRRVAVEVVATGMHLSSEFGETYREIEQDGIPITAKIPILDSADTPAGISRTMANALVGFSGYFETSRPDLLMVLGDRYETAAVCCAAVNARIPVAHLYGGEATEGLIDEAYRHAITKMSYLHFTSTEAYRRRVIQLGESPERVFNVGAMGVENALHQPLLTEQALRADLKLTDQPYACITFHPVTLEADTAEEQVQALFCALDRFPQMQFVITKANADAGGRGINQQIDAYAAARGNVHAYNSLGMIRYLSCVKYAEMVIGNSSSGLVEVPSFGIPTVNIGDRQKGRIQGESILNCPPQAEAIEETIRLAKTETCRKLTRDSRNPYGDGKTSEKIVTVVLHALEGRMDLKKKFYDLPVPSDDAARGPDAK